MKNIKKKPTGTLRMTLTVEYPYSPDNYEGADIGQAAAIDKKNLDEDVSGFIDGLMFMDGAKISATIGVVSE